MCLLVGQRYGDLRSNKQINHPGLPPVGKARGIKEIPTHVSTCLPTASVVQRGGAVKKVFEWEKPGQPQTRLCGHGGTGEAGVS